MVNGRDEYVAWELHKARLHEAENERLIRQVQVWLSAAPAVAPVAAQTTVREATRAPAKVGSLTR